MENKKENKGGRPRVTSPYNNPIRVRFTNDENKVIRELCKKHNTNISDYIRTVSSKGIKYYDKVQTVEKLIHIRSQLKKIGVNINQVATKLNAYVKAHNNLPKHGFTIAEKEKFDELDSLLRSLLTLIEGKTKI